MDFGMNGTDLQMDSDIGLLETSSIAWLFRVICIIELAIWGSELCGVEGSARPYNHFSC